MPLQDACAKGAQPRSFASSREAQLVNLINDERHKTAISACKRGDLVVLSPAQGAPAQAGIVAVSPRGKTLGYIPEDSPLYRYVCDKGRAIATVALISNDPGCPQSVILQMPRLEQ